MSAKRAALYSRVSTTKDQTTENQLLDLRNYCKARGFEITVELEDSGISGTKDDRPGLRRLMEIARKRQVDVVLVWNWDRFARSLSHLINSLDEFNRLGVEFISYQQQIDTGTPQGRMLFGVMASLAEFERSLIIERIHAGLRRARAHNKRLGRPVKLFDFNEANSLRLAGKTFAEIGKALGVSRESVRKLLANNRYQKLVGDSDESQTMSS